MLNLSRLKGSKIAQAIQRKQDRTALLALSSKLDGEQVTSQSQKKIYEILAEGTTLMGRQTNNWKKDTPTNQKEFLKRTRHILELPPKDYTDEQAKNALQQMDFFFNTFEQSMIGTEPPPKNNIITSLQQAQRVAAKAALNTKRWGSTYLHDQLVKDLKDAMK